jgi:hypothetical protein
MASVRQANKTSAIEPTEIGLDWPPLVWPYMSMQSEVATWSNGSQFSALVSRA